MRSTQIRRGYTLIELLLVITILGLLAALSLPAVQHIRAAAQRVTCTSNLRQMGIAAQTYNLTHGNLPAGCVMPYALPANPPTIADSSGIPPPELLYALKLTDSPARRNSDPIRYPFGPNWAVYLLPYLDQMPLFNQAQVSDYLVGYKSGNATLRDRWRDVVKDKVIPFYQCPADVGNVEPFEGYLRSPGPWARGSYAGNAGPGWWQMSLKGKGHREAYGQAGPVFGINYGAQLQRIPDGASATVLFTEVRVGVNARDPRGAWALGYPGSSITAANAIGDCPTPNDKNETSDDIQGAPRFYYPGIGTRHRMGANIGVAGLGYPSWQAQSRSRHRGGVNCCFADGSVHFISNGVDQGAWFRMLSANDGNPTRSSGY